MINVAKTKHNLVGINGKFRKICRLLKYNVFIKSEYGMDVFSLQRYDKNRVYSIDDFIC